MRAALAFACLTLAGCAGAPSATTPPTARAVDAAPAQSGPLTLTLASYADLPGWTDGNQRASLDAFLVTCARFERLEDGQSVGPAYAGAAGPWKAACAEAVDVPEADVAARSFFEARFTPVALGSPDGPTGMTTAYYEPEIEARRTPQFPYTEPMLKRPANLEVVDAPAYDTYARGVRQEVFYRQPSGALTLAPPRGALRRDARLGDAIAYGKISDVVFLQIQGSGRLSFPDGSSARAAYAANNGRPYSSIARHMANESILPIERASNGRMKAWLDGANPAEAGRIVDMNDRYVFFRELPLGPNPSGPIGAAGRPLTDNASIAIDTAWHVHGATFWIAPAGEGAPSPRLAVAQDTGGAIKGPLRADLYFGTGDAPGAAAARVRHQSRWWALVPNAVAAGLPIGASAEPAA